MLHFSVFRFWGMTGEVNHSGFLMPAHQRRKRSLHASVVLKKHLNFRFVCSFDYEKWFTDKGLKLESYLFVLHCSKGLWRTSWCRMPVLSMVMSLQSHLMVKMAMKERLGFWCNRPGMIRVFEYPDHDPIIILVYWDREFQSLFGAILVQYLYEF